MCRIAGPEGQAAVQQGLPHLRLALTLCLRAAPFAALAVYAACAAGALSARETRSARHRRDWDRQARAVLAWRRPAFAAALLGLLGPWFDGDLLRLRGPYLMMYGQVLVFSALAAWVAWDCSRKLARLLAYEPPPSSAPRRSPRGLPAALRVRG